MRVAYAMACRVLQECFEKQIDIPFRSKDPVQYERLTSRAHDVDERSLPELEEAFAAVKIDFTCLPADKVEKFQAGRPSSDIKEITQGIEKDYMARLEELQKELETLNPNMCAPEQHQMETDKLEEIRKQGEDATSKVNALEARFEACKAERYSRFMQCFRHVEKVVQPFYKELTSYDGYDGGSAYLDMDDVEEPYNGGITFTACPPGKRFFPMDLLSGGEKSMASMALLFAMHSYQPPPFMILDEVDAPFDRKNTDSLVQYLQKLKFQCLVISLKDTFFKNSDSLVGVFKDKLAQTSGVVTLPLQKLGNQSVDPTLSYAIVRSPIDVD
jgi:chromosome segregation ATPase